MEKITINASSPYDVVIERGLIQKVGQLIKAVAVGKNAVIISETNVYPIYGKCLKESLEKENYKVFEYIFPAGEKSKNTDTLVSLWEFLAENHITRSDTLIALGGGVTGDLTGFAAATFLRGIKYVGIPTSLLAMVDSSVGGKTAVDLKGGKNLAGAFYQPNLVIIDPDTLSSLPEKVFSDGMAEVIKYGMIDNPDFLVSLTNGCDIEYTIKTCVEEKRNIVALDERDTGIRQLLNFGHTAAHGIEILSNFEISHGSAVAVGMTMITEAAVKSEQCPQDTLTVLKNLLKKYSLPTNCEFNSEQIALAALNDKKRSGDSITLVLPEKTGKCILKKMPIFDFAAFLSKR